jgi:hypothetical protein
MTSFELATPNLTKEINVLYFNSIQAQLLEKLFFKRIASVVYLVSESVSEDCLQQGADRDIVKDQITS